MSTPHATPTHCQLWQVAVARSGDKGNHANLGVVAYSPSLYAFLVEELTADKVKQYFQPLGCREVQRFELPGIGALNFLLLDALQGGASLSLQTDTQGKLLGTQAERIELPWPRDTRDMLR